MPRHHWVYSTTNHSTNIINLPVYARPHATLLPSIGTCSLDIWLQHASFPTRAITGVWGVKSRACIIKRHQQKNMHTQKNECLNKLLCQWSIAVIQQAWKHYVVHLSIVWHKNWVWCLRPYTPVLNTCIIFIWFWSLDLSLDHMCTVANWLLLATLLP